MRLAIPWTAPSGRISGGGPYSRGALFHLLRNPVYIGRIVHKGTVHPGAHDGIIEPALFGAVQARLDAQRRRRGSEAERTVMRAPLAGRLFDAAGEPMSPSFSRGARGATYRYYVSTSLQRGRAGAASAILRRVAAPAIEQLVTEALHGLLPHEADPLQHLTAVHLRPGGIDLVLPGKLRRSLQDQLAPGEGLHPAGGDCIVTVPIELPLRGARRSVSGGARDTASPDPVLIAALRRAHAMLDRDASGRPTISAAPASAYERRLLRLALLDPALQDDILAGRQPRGFRLETFLRSEVPLAWPAQRAALGWPVPPRP